MSKSDKKRKNRWWLWLLSIILFLLLVILGGLTILLKTEKGKAFLTREINTILNDQVFKHAEIGWVEYEFPLNLNLYDVVIYDHRDTVLFSARTVKVRPEPFKLRDSTLSFVDVVISDFHINLNRYVGDPEYNMDYCLKESESSGSSAIHITKIFLEKAVLEEGIFRFNDYASDPFLAPGEKGIDFYRMKATDVSLVLDSVMIEDSVLLKVRNLMLREQSGFRLRDFSSNMSIKDHEFGFRKTAFNSQESKASIDLVFTFDKWKDWQDFNKKITLSGQVDSCLISFPDLTYFAPKLKDFSDKVSLKGNFKGMISDFKVRELALGFNHGEFLQGQLQMIGLPDFNNTFINLRVDDAALSYQLPRDYLPKVQIPELVKKLGRVSTTGIFSGTFKDFVAYGEFETALGKLSSDLRLILTEDDFKGEYSGNLNLYHFDIGKLLNEQDIGLATLSSTVNGHGFDLAHVQSKLESQVEDFNFRGYTYHDVDIDGVLSNSFFNGNLSSADPNALLDFKGKIDFGRETPEYNFTANIANLDLTALHLWTDSLVVKGDVVFDFKAATLEDLEGTLDLKKTRIVLRDRTYVLKQFHLESKKRGAFKTWTLNSDIADGTLKTNLFLEKVPGVLAAAASDYILHRKFDYRYDTDLPADFSFNINLKESDLLSGLIADGLKIGNGSRIEGIYSELEDSIYLKTNVNLLKFKNYQAENIDFLASGSLSKIKLDVDAHGLGIDDSVWVNRYTANFDVDSGSVFLHHHLLSADKRIAVDFNHQINTLQPDSNEITCDSCYAFVDSVNYPFTWKKLQWVGMKDFIIEDFFTGYPTENITANGSFSTEGNYDMQFDINHINTSRFATYLPTFFSTMKGDINGNCHLYLKDENPVADANLRVDDIEFRGFDLKSAQVVSHYNLNTKYLSVNGGIYRENEDPVAVVSGGLYYNKEPSIDMQFSMDGVPIGLFDTLSSPYVSRMRGTCSGKLHIKGPLSQPGAVGNLQFDSASVFVNYLNTRYHFSDNIIIDENHLRINNMKLYDKFNSLSVLNGNITHNQFSSFDLNLALNSTNFLMLNTNETNNTIYYGTAFATGVSKFTGPLLSVKMDFKLSPEKGTKLYLPIAEEQTYTQHSFIRFTSAETNKKTFQTVPTDFSFDMVLDINENADIELIFDKQLGDIIKGNGNGQLKLSLSPMGEFEMFGDFIIESGNYLFTAFELINKRFSIVKGSKVSWVGDPYDALINIKATYDLKANPYYMINSLPQIDKTQAELYNRAIPVKAIANLKGSLLKPEIKLNFEFVNDGTIDLTGLQREVNSLKMGQEEIDKQVVSLLILNRFMPVYTGDSKNPDIFETGLNSGLGDLISNQLTYWLSSISDNFQVDLKYRNEYAAEGIVLTQKELQLALSTSLFSDRVTVSYSYEFQQNYRPNTEVSYKVNPDGTVRLKIFNRQSNNPVINQNSKTYGVGFYFRKEFNSFKDLFQSKKKVKID